MREILFRGKDCGNVWIYGGHCIVDDGLGSTVGCIWQVGADRGIPIIPETVGQWTGLTDTDGVKIFEGDILRLTHESEESIHEVRWYGDKNYPAFDVHPNIDSDSNGLSYAMAVCTVEVISNIHGKGAQNE